MKQNNNYITRGFSKFLAISNLSLLLTDITNIDVVAVHPLDTE